jgi:hypothetical protein
MMTGKLIMRMSRASALFAFGLISLADCASGRSDCKQAKGETVQVAVGTAPSTGAITNGGDLNGTLTDVFTSTAFSTPDTAIVSFAGDLTITTNQGRLVASAVHFFDFSNGVASVQARINPTASTGRFAGASGFLFLNGVTTNSSPFTIQLTVSGQICTAN